MGYYHRSSHPLQNVMKKTLRVIIILGVVVAAFFIFQSTEKPAPPDNAALLTNSVAPTGSKKEAVPPAASEQKANAPALAQSPTAGFLGSNVMAVIRACLASPDRAGYDQAFKGLVDYINAHPEQVDEYVALLRSERDEHVLRAFALALGETEVGLLANDQIIGAAIELAKDSSFEQRQHIMLNLMGKVPEMRDDVYQAIHGLSRNDPNSQVKTSAVVVFADWMDRLPDQKEMLLGQLAEIFKTAQDEDVRGFTYQVLALHRDNLSPEMQLAISEQFKIEADPFSANLLAAALSAAPDEIRQPALSHAQSAFATEADLEKRRNFLLQIVCLARKDAVPLLQKNSVGESLLAQDARDYLILLASNTGFNPDEVLQQKAIRDARLHGIPHEH